MSLLNDSEKVKFLIDVLDRHIDKLSGETTLANYLASIRGFLKTEDPNLQKVAFSNSELFVDNLAYKLNSQISYKQSIGSLIAALDKVGYADSMDAAALILEFEELLNQMPTEEAETIYKERWVDNKSGLD
ncbi:hypothetical protein [Paenibacillus xylaniclasticus]|uniref:hypothetical protein n=1 Tax=Paenibacillus xylaniclasticus TaxID=588083 RepID=UPI000FD7F452|nr:MULTISPECIES: hypothetical protein [Paenibacillus]GFN33859.1 hypothetical protein PCURB6_41190 [Paenibacillus curdlanolyticus]